MPICNPEPATEATSRRFRDGKPVFFHGDELAGWLREQAS